MNNPKTKSFFNKTSLKRTVRFLIEHSYFTVSNVHLLQIVCIPMVIEPAPFWANLYYYYESKYITNLMTDKLRGGRFYRTFRFIDNLYALNDGVEYGKVFLEIYPTEPELKGEHNGSHAAFLDLDISLDKEKIIYVFDKPENFDFHIVRMLLITSNIPSIVFYSSFMPEL